MEVRFASPSDWAEVWTMASKQYFNDFYSSIPLQKEDAFKLFNLMTSSAEDETGFLLVADEQGKLVGMLGCLVYPYPFNSSYKVAQSIFWWRDYKVSGNVGSTLLKYGNTHRKAIGCQVFLVGTTKDTPKWVGSFLRDEGFFEAETFYIQENV
jgi:hypothetical protein